MTKLTRKEKIEKLKGISNPASATDKWRQIAEWNEKHADALEDFAIIAVRIAEVLKSKKMTQKELAQLLQVQPQALTRIMKGRQNLTLQTIRKIESVLGISLLQIHITDRAVVKQSVKFVPVNIYYGIKSEKVYSGDLVDNKGTSGGNFPDIDLKQAS